MYCELGKMLPLSFTVILFGNFVLIETIEIVGMDNFFFWRNSSPTGRI